MSNQVEWKSSDNDNFASLLTVNQNGEIRVESRNEKDWERCKQDNPAMYAIASILRDYAEGRLVRIEGK